MFVAIPLSGAKPGMAATATDPVCGTRTDLLNRLAAAVEELGRVKVELTLLLPASKVPERLFVESELIRLRDHCNAVRIELESHRAQHGC